MKIRLLLAFVALVIPSALAQKVTTQFDQSTDFSKYKTFAIRGGQLTSKDPVLNSEIVRKQIESDIARDLTAKGLTQSTGRADLNVRYHLGSANRKQVERYPAGRFGQRTRAVRTAESRGTLTIDFHERASQALVWRAIATEEKSEPSDVAKKLDDMVRKAIDKYPPKK